MNKKKVRIIGVCGSDGVGKTTQLRELRRWLRNKKRQAYDTKQLGGDGACAFQQAARNFLLSPRFPKNRVDLEEACFALADLAGMEDTEINLRAEPSSVALKDRCLPSHIVYALAKGMSMDKALITFGEVTRRQHVLDREFGAVTFVLVPDEPAWVLDRIRARNAEQGTPIVERLENLDVQGRVISGMRMFKDMVASSGLSVELVEVTKAESVIDVHNKILKRLTDKYEIGGTDC
jgi:thymidylate kinase